MAIDPDLILSSDPQDSTNKKLLNILQSAFPLSNTPFDDIATMLEITEDEVMGRIYLLKKEKVIRQISAIFDTRMLGYRSCLVAAKVSPDKLEQAAAEVNRHPGVSHNYQRTNNYNMWFTMAIPPDSKLGLEKTLEIISTKAEIESLRALPSIKIFKIGVMLDMVKGGGVTSTAATKQSSFFEEGEPPSEEDISFIRALQEDLPITKEPFLTLAEKHSLDKDTILIKAKEFLKNNTMRRFAAVLHHRKAGFKENVMGVWNAPDEIANEAGEKFATFKAVSHCYLRPKYDDFPYNIYTMLHGTSKESLKETMSKMAADSGVETYGMLYSVKEFKKVRVEYFSKKLHEWEAE